MSWETEYNIEFKGLKEGLHQFRFEIENKFFEHFEESLANVGNIEVLVELEKRSAFLKLHLKLSGWLELVCDRCLENYQQEIENQTELFIKFGEKDFDDGDNVIWVLPQEHCVNVAQIIYEYIMLGIPLKHVHPDEEGENSCNPEMLERLDNYSHPEVEETDEDDIDPRWAALKNLKNNN